MKKLIFATLTILLAATVTCCKRETKEQSPTGEVIEVNQGTELKSYSEYPIVMDFNAEWCGPCRAFAPIFEEASKKYEGKINFMSVNVDENPELADKYEVQSIPTVIYIAPDGNTWRTIGLLPADRFDDELQKLL